MKRTLRHREGGLATLLLVSFILGAFLIGLSLSNWISIQRRGDMRMRLAIKERALSQSAIQETMRRFIETPALANCANAPQSFTYVIDRTTVTVTIDCSAP